MGDWSRVLDTARLGGKDGWVTDPSPSTDELEERGRAIFARLRDDPAATDDADPSTAPPPPVEHQGDASVSDDQPETPDVDTAADTAEPDLAPHSSPESKAETPQPPDAPAERDSSPPVATPPTAPSDLTTALDDAADEIVQPAVAAKPTYGDVRPPLPRIIAVANQKGGVGKTTTAVNLGACLADLGYRTLVVDLDPQGNASTGLGINIRGLQASMYDVILSDVPIEDCVEASSVRNLFVAPASLDLAGAEIELVPAFSRELRLKQALAEVRDDYDYVLIDCPPSLGLLTINGMAAATEVLVPIQCEYYALEGLGQLLRNVGLVQKNLNPTLEVSTIVLVMYDARTKLSDQVAREVREHFGPKVCRIMIPRTVRLSEAPSFGQPIIAFDPSSRGAIAYRELAKEVSGGPA